MPERSPICRPMALEIPQKPSPYELLLVSLMAVGLFFFLDQNFALMIDQPTWESLRYWAREVTNVGLGDWWYGLTVGTFLFCRFLTPQLKSMTSESLKKSKELMRWSFLSFVGLTASGLALQVIKHIVGRQRPHVSPEHIANIFDPLTLHWHWHSFPSGHAQVLGSAAAAFCLLRPKAKIAIIAVAFGFALTRPITLQHFLSDIWVGFFLGYWGSQAAYRWAQSHSKFAYSRLGIE